MVKFRSVPFENWRKAVIGRSFFGGRLIAAHTDDKCGELPLRSSVLEGISWKPKPVSPHFVKQPNGPGVMTAGYFHRLTYWKHLLVSCPSLVLDFNTFFSWRQPLHCLDYMKWIHAKFTKDFRIAESVRKVTFIHTRAQISHSHTSDRLSPFLSRFNRNEKFPYYWRLFTLIRSGYLAAELLINEFTPQIRRVIVCKQDLRPVRRQCLTGCDKALESSWKHSLQLCSTFEWIRFVKTVWQHESIRAVLVAIEGAEESYLTVFPVKITLQLQRESDGLLITYSDLTTDQPSTKNWRLCSRGKLKCKLLFGIPMF